MARGTVIYGQAKGQIEVAVIEGPVPIDTHLMAAHEAGEDRGIKGILQDLHVGIHLSVPFELLSISADGHVGQNKQMVEVYIKASSEFLAIVFLQFQLRRREGKTAGIVDELQR